LCAGGRAGEGHRTRRLFSRSVLLAASLSRPPSAALSLLPSLGSGLVLELEHLALELVLLVEVCHEAEPGVDALDLAELVLGGGRGRGRGVGCVFVAAGGESASAQRERNRKAFPLGR